MSPAQKSNAVKLMAQDVRESSKVGPFPMPLAAFNAFNAEKYNAMNSLSFLEKYMNKVQMGCMMF